MQELKKIFPVTCLNSEDISSNQSIAKTASGWEIFKHPTPGEKNIHTNSAPIAKITIQKGKLENEIPFSINLDGSDSSDPDEDTLTYKWTFPDKIIEKKNPASYKFEISGTHEISLTVTDTEGLSATETITVHAQNSAEDLESAELLEQIIQNQTPHASTSASTPTSPGAIPLWLSLLLGLTILGATILKLLYHSRSTTSP
jgi:PKD repeat protein